MLHDRFRVVGVKCIAGLGLNQLHARPLQGLDQFRSNHVHAIDGRAHGHSCWILSKCKVKVIKHRNDLTDHHAHGVLAHTRLLLRGTPLQILEVSHGAQGVALGLRQFGVEYANGGLQFFALWGAVIHKGLRLRFSVVMLTRFIRVAIGLVMMSVRALVWLVGHGVFLA
jgi:hypothetical protein